MVVINPDGSLGSPKSLRILRKTLYLKLGALYNDALRMEAGMLLVRQ